jgi:hypothetical protein
MNIQELATAHVEKIAAKAIILNNQHLGMVVQWEDNFYAGNRGHTYLGNPDDRSQVYPDYVRVCNSFNVPCERVMFRRDLRAALERMLAAKTPYVLDVVTPYSEHVLPFIPRSYRCGHDLENREVENSPGGRTAMQAAVLLLLLAVMLSGCSWGKRKAVPATTQGTAATRGQNGNGGNTRQALVTPASGTIGRVKTVNASGRFVVISYPVGTLPALEQRLNAHRNGLKVAELKVTGPTRDTHTVADILAGECQVGDEVTED